MIHTQINTAHLIRPYSIPAKSSRPASVGKITEIVIDEQDPTSFALLLPMLAQLSQDSRWFMWIAPPFDFPKNLLGDAGVALNKSILIRNKPDQDIYGLAIKALEAGTNHAVVHWDGYLSAEQYQGLEAAAKRGGTHAVIIRRRVDA
ncbi:MAG: cell division inhibitor SulA [Pontibacterium sp.]